MKSKEVILNLIVWPVIASLVVIAAKLAGQITWNELFKLLPIVAILSILLTAGLLSAIRLLSYNDDLRIEHRKDMQVLRGVLEGQPVPSARTGHEYLGDPSVSACIMGAIPKRDAATRIARFYKNMEKGVTYRFLYLDEPGTRAGLIAYCKELSSLVERKKRSRRGETFAVGDRFQAKIVPVERIQLSFDIFDHESDQARMLIHFPSFGPLSGEEFNRAWMLSHGDAIRHYAGVFQHIWSEAGEALNILESAQKEMLVFGAQEIR